MSKQGIVKINLLEKITSARWQNKKPWTSYGQTHQFNNDGPIFFVKKPEISGEAPVPQVTVTAATSQLVGKPETPCHQNLSPWHRAIRLGETPSPSFSLRREGKDWTMHSTFVFFKRLPRDRFLSCLNQSAEMNSPDVSGWELLRTKMVVWTSTQFLHVCLSHIMACNFLSGSVLVWFCYQGNVDLVK